MGYTILIVDDDDDDRILFREWLKGSDYEIIEACNGNDGIKKCVSDIPHCIILDFLMRESDGLQMLISLRREYNNETPIIFITGYDTKEVIEDALELGATKFVSKNNMSAELLHQSVLEALAA